ncbi:hypothetical protein [Siccirubricoccus sp. G192]|uniref:hypothetical protein n=1 Tax=Siccirubricoccus sp. G192 TaxID=2849651 RepID=UPI001C2CA562|nr:hypothetical protein [Siccirubricoccus sp. G192]MBV1800348.1 hypothetical protein [Siccirubricoccus sp. G192]MBV1800570.1 hypothetical protein [Siccirubricoccus sp. G192]
MSVRLDGPVICLEGECRVEDTEPLLAALQGGPGRVVDLSGAGPLHAAIVQVLLALRPPLSGPARDPFTARWLLPLLAAKPPG